MNCNTTHYRANSSSVPGDPTEFGQGYYRYERSESQDGPHHHHLVCRGCGRVEDFQGCEVASLAAKLEAERGFKVERHQLELYGLCPSCREKPLGTVRRTSGGRTVAVA